MTSSRFQFAFATLAVLAASAAHAQTYTGIQDAIPTQSGLTGNVKDDGWYNLTNGAQSKTVDGVATNFNALTGYPAVFNSSSAWPTPVAAQVNTGGTAANLNKVANNNGSGGLDKFNANGTRNSTAWNGSGFGPYPAGNSLYAISFSNEYNAKGGTFGVFEANPVANLGTVVFQVEMGSANGYDFHQPGVTTGGTTPLGNANNLSIGQLAVTNYFPSLNLTFTDSTTVSLAADYAQLSAKGFNGTIPMPTGPNGSNVDEPIWVNLYAFQWDLSSFSNVASYNVTWNVVEHSQTYAARLSSSDVFTQVVAVPEPQTYAMMLAGLGMMAVMLRRRKQA